VFGVVFDVGLFDTNEASEGGVEWFSEVVSLKPGKAEKGRWTPNIQLLFKTQESIKQNSNSPKRSSITWTDRRDTRWKVSLCSHDV